jgi:N-acetylmuramoyl-L-alanine amidase
MTNAARSLLFLLALVVCGASGYFVTLALTANSVEVPVIAEAPLEQAAQNAPPVPPAKAPQPIASYQSSQQPKQQFIVCLDPGHPSEVNDGMHKVNGISETEVNWDVSLRIKKILENSGVTVVMTKSRMDERVTNRQRANIANSAKSHLMLRIHADAGGGTGFTIYYPRKQGTKDGVTGPSQSVMQASAVAAKHMHTAMAEKLKGKLKDNGLRGDEQSYVGQRQGAFTGSIFSQVPVMLIEMCFLDNKNDAEWIKVEANKNLMAHAIAAGAIRYLTNR